MEDLISLGLFVALLIVTYFWGSHVEKKHLKSIRERETTLPAIPLISWDKRTFKQELSSAEMISANVVIGADYFKTVLSSIVSMFGGNISVLESVLDRARREALIRMKEKAKDADYIANLRYETTSVQESRKRAPAVEIYVYATAIYLKK